MESFREVAPRLLFFLVTLIALPIADAQPATVTVVEGRKAVLPCGHTFTSSDPKPSVIEWLRDNKSLPIFIKIGRYAPHIDESYKGRMTVRRRSADLTIRRVVAKDEDWYECRVIFLNGEIARRQSLEGQQNAPFTNGTWVKLIVTAPPVFNLTPPLEMVKSEGEVLLLRCLATGRPTPVMSWLKDGYPMWNGQDGVRTSGGQLAISDLKKSHAGKYACLAQNVVDLIETTTIVHIQAAPTLVAVPKNTTVRDGEQVMFSCKAEGYPTDIRYEWFYHGSPIQSVDAMADRYVLEQDGTVAFDVHVEDAGVIGCQAKNVVGKSRIANATLTVKFPARVRKMPPVMYAGLGLSVNLPCPADAVPPVTTVTWHRDGETLSIDKDERLSFGENGALVINPVRKSDSSRYSCEPYNNLGTQGKSTQFSLVVYKAPKFTLKPEADYQAEIGKPLTMTCDGTGDPPLLISWMKVDELGEEVDISSEGDRINSKGGNITIRNVVKNDHGKWQCVLSNRVMKVRADAMVYVKYTTPHSVTNVRVDTSKYNAQISWEPGYDGGHDQHFIIWYKRTDMGNHSWQTHRVVGYRKVATVGNLDPDTIYQFAILPENILGSGQFSKEVMAKTKSVDPVATQDTPTLEPPGRMNYHVNGDGYLLLMWQPPLDVKQDELLGYVIESRMLLEEKEDENYAEGDIVLHEDGTTPLSPPGNPQRSSRSLKRWSELLKRRVRRDAPNTVSSKIVAEEGQDQRWTDWETLARVQANMTELEIPADKLYRDQLYEFHVIAVSVIVFSSPSAVIAVSTSGLKVYPLFVGPSHVIAAASAGPAVIGVTVAVVILVVIAAVLTATWCFRKRRKMSATQEEKQKLDRRSRSSDSSASDSDRGMTSSGKGGKSNRSIFRLKKNMLKADKKIGRSYSNTDELTGIGRKVSHSDILQNPVQLDGKGPAMVRRISRTADGKFRVTESEVEAGSNKSTSGSPRKKLSYQTRPHSAEWDTREPLLQKQDQVDDSLEIDCSRSDIEVRYVKDGRGKGSCQSLSTSSQSGPKQYNLLRRQIGPCDKSFDSSVGDASFHNVGEFSRPHHTRQNVMSPMPHGQYVNMRSSGSSHGTRNPQYRISSPPHFSDYSIAPSSPSKYKYQKHPERIPYSTTSRDSYSVPVEGLVYDPRYTRIEPIYEVGPYKPHNAPNRHSSFVIDTRRELSNHPYPYRAIQICSRTTSIPTEPNDRSSYPTPKWRDAAEPQYHTLSAVKQFKGQLPSNATSEHFDQNNVQLSLRRHNANAAASRKTTSKNFSLTTNSLGRPRKRNEDTSRRRRVQSMDNLTWEALALEDRTSTTRPSGSVDLLSSMREEGSFLRKNEKQHDPALEAVRDRITVGFDAGDEASDITNFSSAESSRTTESVTTGRQKSKGKTHKSNTSALNSPRDDDSSAVSSSLAQPLLRRTEITSSGYDSHNTSHASTDSPALSLPLCSPPNVAMRPSPHDHDRTSTASSSDRSRKDTSSVDEKYEWDSEFAMESEIVEALRHFGNHKRTGSVSQALVDEIRKLGVDKVQAMDKDQLSNLEQEVKSRRRTSSGEDSDRSTTVDTSDMYTKESMERRCAALKMEYQRYQMENRSEPSIKR